MIPKVIHYCWYGKNEFPKEIKKCMSTWDKLSDYTIKEWNESNCDFNANSFTKVAYENKRWGYLSDYFRCLALYNQGGIYLDTDVKIVNKFDDLLYNKAFLGFIFDSSIGTAIMGFEQHHPLLKIILETYETAIWIDEYHIKVIMPSGRLTVCKVNNDLLTGVLLDIYSSFKLNGKKQLLNDDVLVLPKEDLELGYINPRKGYSIHTCQGAWRSMTLKKKINAMIKNLAGLVPFVNLDIAIRTVTYQKKYVKETPYYNRYLQDIEK